MAHYLKMNGAAFDHSIASNKVQMLSTTESELNSASRCARAVMGYRHLLNEMPTRHQLVTATLVEGDNSACVTICNNPGSLSDATKHMKRSALYMREVVVRQQIKYQWGPTRLLQSDAGTKQLTEKLHTQHIVELGGKAQGLGWKRYKFHQLKHQPYETMLAKEEQDRRRASRNASATSADHPDGESVVGGASLRKQKRKRPAETENVDQDVQMQDHTHFINRANLPAKERSLLLAQILGFMSNKNLHKLQHCVKGMTYPGGIGNHSFLAALRAGFPKKSQKNLHDDDDFTRVYEPCEHLCVDSFELSVQTIHGGRYVYVFTDAKRSKKRWAMLARARAHYPRVLTRLLGKVRALGWEVKCIRSDGAGELVGEPARQVMDHHCIALEESSPHRPEENGSSERAVRAITEKARALMLNAPHLPASCGGLAVLHASALLEFHTFDVDAEDAI